MNSYIIDILKQVFKSKNIKSQLEKTYLSLQYHSNNHLSNKEGELNIIGKYSKNKPIIFFLHGGGWEMGSSKDHADFIYNLASIIQVFSYNYTLGKYPYSINDCFNLYKNLLSRCDKIYIIGLSSGGTLALQIALLCKKTNIIMPKGVIAISPLTDNSLPYYKTFIDWTTESGHKKLIANYKSNVKTIDSHSIYNDIKILNPIKGNYSNTCPIYIFTGSGNITYPRRGYWNKGELFYKDNINFFKLHSNKIGTNIKLYQYKNMFHCFVLFPKYISEANDVIKKIKTICK